MLGRRSFLVGLGVGLSGCSQCGSQQPPGRADPSATVLPPPPVIPEGGVGERGQVITETWRLGGSDGRAVTIVPAWRKPDEKLPLLFAFHGRGEAQKGPDLGVMGWPKDYKLLRAIERVCAPPLTTDDFETFVEAPRLSSTTRRSRRARSPAS